MMAPLNVSLSTIAAHSLGSVKVLVQPEKDSLEGDGDAEQVDAAVAGDGLGEDFLVRGPDEFVHEPGGEGVFDPVALLGRGGAETDEQVGFAGSGVADEA